MHGWFGVLGVVQVLFAVFPTEEKKGSLTIGGIVEEEEMGTLGRTLRRKGTARAAVENVLTALTALLQKNMRNYDIHLNFPGGVPVDGPSAGVGAALAIYSAGQSSHHRQCRKDLREKSGQKKLVKGGA